MISPSTTTAPRVAAPPRPTLWGLTPTELHDRFWAARGVQVVRAGEPSAIVHEAELFLLTDADTFAIFKLSPLVEMLSWDQPDLMFIRLHDSRERGYQERVCTSEDGCFERFHRIYHDPNSRLHRVALTPIREIAQLWQGSKDPGASWRRLRRQIPDAYRATVSVKGHVFDRNQDTESMQFLRQLMAVWKRPDATIGRARKIGSGIWSDQQTSVPGNTRFIGNAWIGAGRTLPENSSIIGPAVIWDDPEARPDTRDVQWQELEPSNSFDRPVKPRQLSSFDRAAKRVFDILFALFALAVTLPIYPLVMLAIWIEDGSPFFFGHTRETLGGREFPCIKFRSMRKDAEKIKQELIRQNQADGPQFFIKEDPRLTRVGRFIRKTNIDELPQFWNVLVGHMSVVGPRPSPRKENQFCPAWREARLSVRPGITGLWQVSRTRRVGLDFQEWIKYDIQYVENASWWLDLSIIWKTITIIIRGGDRS